MCLCVCVCVCVCVCILKSETDIILNCHIPSLDIPNSVNRSIGNIKQSCYVENDTAHEHQNACTDVHIDGNC